MSRFDIAQYKELIELANSTSLNLNLCEGNEIIVTSIYDSVSPETIIFKSFDLHEIYKFIARKIFHIK